MKNLKEIAPSAEREKNWIDFMQREAGWTLGAKNVERRIVLCVIAKNVKILNVLRIIEL